MVDLVDVVIVVVVVCSDISYISRVGTGNSKIWFSDFLIFRFPYVFFSLRLSDMSSNWHGIRRIRKTSAIWDWACAVRTNSTQFWHLSHWRYNKWYRGHTGRLSLCLTPVNLLQIFNRKYKKKICWPSIHIYVYALLWCTLATCTWQQTFKHHLILVYLIHTRVNVLLMLTTYLLPLLPHSLVLLTMKTWQIEENVHTNSTKLAHIRFVDAHDFSQLTLKSVREKVSSTFSFRVCLREFPYIFLHLLCLPLLPIHSFYLLYECWLCCSSLAHSAFPMAIATSHSRKLCQQEMASSSTITKYKRHTKVYIYNIQQQQHSVSGRWRRAELLHRVDTAKWKCVYMVIQLLSFVGALSLYMMCVALMGCSFSYVVYCLHRGDSEQHATTTRAKNK